MNDTRRAPVFNLVYEVQADRYRRRPTQPESSKLRDFNLVCDCYSWNSKSLDTTPPID